MIEVSDRCLRERLAERRHAVVPLHIPDHREPFDVGEVLHEARFAMRDDRTMFLLVFTDQGAQLDPQDTNAHKDALRAEFGQAGWECPQILTAMDSTDEVCFDRVSQIRMDTWSQGRVGLIGDAAFCPSLLAGQGAALSMIAAYVLAGELGRTGGEPKEALECYEHRLQPFVASKQKSAVDFAGSLAPKTRLGLFFRNRITKVFNLPFIAKFAMGPSLLDRIDLPDYADPQAAPCCG